MPVRRPSVEDLKEIARHYRMDLTDEEATVFSQLIDGAFRSLDRVDQMIEPKLPVRYPRTGGRRPEPEENPYGAWAWKCSVNGAPEGPLIGKRIALKDVVAVAGVPLTNGTRVLEGFIPDIDATVVTRILDAGGEIVGKAMCTSSSLSAGSFNSHPWGVLNPRKPGYQAGGSSSGSAVLVALGEVNMATGGDQGGSIRIPASLCGVVGMKPTFGLVPYTGCMCNEWTVDHIGPLTSTVADCALLLEVIAGPDGLDPRQ
ncbi:MAG: amidase family protein, partial [Dehalococcoidia bacterium]